MGRIQMILEGKLAGYSWLQLTLKTFQIHSPAGKLYNITLWNSGALSCDCPSGIYRGYCKHLDFFKGFLVDDPKLSREKAQEIWSEMIVMLDPLKEYRWVLAGSFRREVRYLKDLDIVTDAMAGFVYLRLKRMEQVTISMHGSEIVRGSYKGVPFDFRSTTEESWGACLLFYTGPKELNIFMRAKAKAMEMRLNEKALQGKEVKIGRTEAAIFEALGMEYMTPKQRQTWKSARDMYGV